MQDYNDLLVEYWSDADLECWSEELKDEGIHLLVEIV
jgi:hypothetical protein